MRMFAMRADGLISSRHYITVPYGRRQVPTEESRPQIVKRSLNAPEHIISCAGIVTVCVTRACMQQLR